MIPIFSVALQLLLVPNSQLLCFHDINNYVMLAYDDHCSLLHFLNQDQHLCLAESGLTNFPWRFISHILFYKAHWVGSGVCSEVRDCDIADDATACDETPYEVKLTNQRNKTVNPIEVLWWNISLRHSGLEWTEKDITEIPAVMNMIWEMHWKASKDKTF